MQDEITVKPEEFFNPEPPHDMPTNNQSNTGEPYKQYKKHHIEKWNLIKPSQNYALGDLLKLGFSHIEIRIMIGDKFLVEVDFETFRRIS